MSCVMLLSVDKQGSVGWIAWQLVSSFAVDAVECVNLHVRGRAQEIITYQL